MAKGDTIGAIREAAAEHPYDWPTTADEAWKFTNLEHLSKRKFDFLFDSDGLPSLGDLREHIAAEHQLKFVNGVLDGEPSMPETIELTQDDDRFAELLNCEALINHPVASKTLVNTPKVVGLKITGETKEPLQTIFFSSGDDISAHPLLVVDIEEGASLTLLENHIGTDTGLSLPVLVVRIGKGATLNHARIQEEGADRHHLGQAVFTLASKAVYRGVAVQAGSVLSRAESHISLIGENADAFLTTLCLARQEQVMDVTTFVGHEVPSCTSMQVIRSVLDDKARGVFQGKVLVAPDAQHTDGNQMSRALLLSPKCEADAKPELEIYADDVACSHGATVGEIDDDSLFYLMSRGIPVKQARQMLIEAFLADALAGVENETLHDFAKPAVAKWLAEMTGE